jgi:transposase
MGKPYSMDLRERVVAAIEGGLSTGKAAKRYSVGKATAGAWARLKRATGSVAPAKQGKPKGSVPDPHADFILGALKQESDTTLDEMVERLRKLLRPRRIRLGLRGICSSLLKRAILPTFIKASPLR